MADELPPAAGPAPRAATERIFLGEGFGSRALRLPKAPADDRAPAVTSMRGMLRQGLPAIYQDGDFAMRFVGALEHVLDPVHATLDGLHHYLDPDVAPRAMVEAMAWWLGDEAPEGIAEDALRARARAAADAGRLRGTRRGMELVLRLEFPDVPLRLEDHGGVSWPGKPGGGDRPAAFVVYCDVPVSEDVQAQIARCIEREKPVHASYRLRVKARKPS